MAGNFKFQAQDSFLNNFFGRLGDLKNQSHFLKKGTFTCLQILHKENLSQGMRLSPNVPTNVLSLKKL